MKIYEMDDQLCLFVPDSLCGKTCPEPSPAENLRGRISASFWRRSPELSAAPFQSLDLTPGAGNLLGEFYWEPNSPYVGASLTLNTGVSPKDAVVSFLSQTLQADPPLKYYLSRTACLGILRRASERGKELPLQLKKALMMQAGIPGTEYSEIAAPAEDFDDNCPDPHSAGFCGGASPSAGSIGYETEVSPTLKAGESGTNQIPSVLCLNDQGGKRWEAHQDVSGALRAQEHGHQPLVLASQQGGAELGVGRCPTITSAAGTSGNNQPILFENHGIDARYTGPHPVAPTMSARYGAGGNNVPLIGRETPESYCIVGNAIDRQPKNGGNGIGYQADLAYTLTGMDRHAVFSRQRVDVFQENVVVSTESARQNKDATDLVYQETVGALTGSDRKGPSNQYVSQDKCILEAPHLIRRLTPLECERLQGFPDGWTDLPDASDAARYKALGNSVAIPCVEYVMSGLAAAMGTAE